MGGSVKITFYYADGCWVCDTAQEMLNGLGHKYALDVTRVNIFDDDELYELYRHDVPVLEFEDGSALYHRIRKKDLLGKLECASRDGEEAESASYRVSLYP